MHTSEVADRLALQDLVIAYASAADRRDVAGFTALFLPDATLTARRGDGEASAYAGTERLAEVPQRLSRYHQTFHVVTNHRCEIDGDTATGEAVCQAHHLTTGRSGRVESDPIESDDGRTRDLMLAIRYTDAYQRTTGGWRFATRDVHILWTSEGPVAIA
jgi:SnoaL-like domain